VAAPRPPQLDLLSDVRLTILLGGYNPDRVEVKTRRVGRNELWWLSNGQGGHGDEPAPVGMVEGSLAGKFRYAAETATTPGLRTPQLGALHAVLAAQSVDISEPTTVVLPTGTGKTETMLAVYCERPRRTLIVVPSDSLRTQIGRKFATLGILPRVEALVGEYLAPTVGILKSRLETTDQVRELVGQAAIIVATAAALSRFATEALQEIVDSTHQLFIDEAHHVAARTWTEIAKAFSGKPIVQFTATPFREDGRIVDGRVVYAYPLRLAQTNGWFARINYRAITSGSSVDRELAIAAIRQLREDLAAGLDHILMARVQTVPRSEVLLDLYEELAADLCPLRIDSKLAAGKQREAKERLDNRSSRIVVCVDMLGEGFDLPSLKIAAVHDPHRSLAVTLQFVGRFTRAGGQELGDASVFVPRQINAVDERLRRLYGEDADWNTVVRDLTQAEVEYERARTDFETGFGQLPTEVVMRSVQPKMSTVVYRAARISWNPQGVYEVFDEAALLTKKIAINAKEKVVWFVTAEKIPVQWGESNPLEDIVHHLYVVHVDSEAGRLYVNSSNNESVHQELAKAIGGGHAELIQGDEVYRVLTLIRRRVPTNVGLLDAVSRNRRFSMHVGADVLEGFGPTAAQKSKTNIFAHGYADQSRVSFGASRKGRIWSHKVSRGILDWVHWARGVGSVVADSSIELASVMSGFIIPKAARSRPALVPLGIEWPHNVGMSASETLAISHNASSHPLIEVDLVLRTFDRDEPIEFEVVSESWSIRYRFSFNDEGPAIVAVSEDATITLPKRGPVGLATFMSTEGLTVYFENEALLSPDGYVLQPDRTRPKFSPDRLEVVDWSNINIRKESQGPNRDEDSVQHRVATVLAAEAPWEVIVDDDGAGEIADLLLMRRESSRLVMVLAHCKYSQTDAPGARVGDLYEVCGQAEKCHKARADAPGTIQRAIRRERTRQRKGRSGLMVGSLDTLHTLLEECWRLDPVVVVLIAQPGLSKVAISSEQSELLGCVDFYLSETYGSQFRVLCSP
jgi:superfamily II DNA or RNA helicase